MAGNPYWNEDWQYDIERFEDLLSDGDVAGIGAHLAALVDEGMSEDQAWLLLTYATGDEMSDNEFDELVAEVRGSM